MCMGVFIIRPGLSRQPDGKLSKLENSVRWCCRPRPGCHLCVRGWRGAARRYAHVDQVLTISPRLVWVDKKFSCEFVEPYEELL